MPNQIRSMPAASIIGIYLSYWLDAASGGLVVLVQGVFFTLAYLFAPRQGIIGRRIAAGRARREAGQGVSPASTRTSEP